MPKYDFDEMTDRRGTFSSKWNVAENELPLWVADMDFKAAPEIIAAMSKRLEHGIFGYTDIPNEWKQAYINWNKNRHGFEIAPDWLMFCTGIVPAISSLVRKLTTPNENVLLLTPVYNIFYNSIVNNGCRVAECPLVYDRNAKDSVGAYNIDFNLLEEMLANPQTSLMILCNPHNPVGRIWSRDELAKIGQLCKKYGVTVISDEIHCDLVAPGREYVPFASVDDDCRNICISCIAPTKTFNIAGLQTAAIYAANPFLRHKAWRAINTDEIAEPNVFAVSAAIAAFTEGGEWLDELRNYLWQNRSAAEKFIQTEIPGIRPVPAEATYLMWIDCSSIMDKKALKKLQKCNCPDIAAYIRRETGLYLSAGEHYGNGGRHFLRLNLACPRERLMDAMTRLKRGILSVFNWKWDD